MAFYYTVSDHDNGPALQRWRVKITPKRYTVSDPHVAADFGTSARLTAMHSYYTPLDFKRRFAETPAEAWDRYIQRTERSLEQVRLMLARHDRNLAIARVALSDL